MKLTFQHGDETISLETERIGEDWKILLPDGSNHLISVTRKDGDTLLIEERVSDTLSARVFSVPFARDKDSVQFSYTGNTYQFEPQTTRAAAKKSTIASGVLIAPMAGVVADIMVTEGDEVEAYQPLAVIEAMKIMSTLEAPFAGTVKIIHYKKLQQVTHGSPVIEIAPREESEKP